MAKKESLTIVAHDHFRKANVLHGYVQEHLGEATKHALETGKELIAAKSEVPHGKWEIECERLFDGSLRNAQFYMQFARDFSRLKSASKSALLMLEGTLQGAAKAAREAIRGDGDGSRQQNRGSSELPPTSCKPETVQPPPKYSQPGRTGVREPGGGRDTEPEIPTDPGMVYGQEGCEERPPAQPQRRTQTQPHKQIDRGAWQKRWTTAIGPVVRLVDQIAKAVGENKSESHKTVQEHLKAATDEMKNWMKQ